MRATTDSQKRFPIHHCGRGLVTTVAFEARFPLLLQDRDCLTCFWTYLSDRFKYSTKIFIWHSQELTHQGCCFSTKPTNCLERLVTQLGMFRGELLAENCQLSIDFTLLASFTQWVEILRPATEVTDSVFRGNVLAAFHARLLEGLAALAESRLSVGDSAAMSAHQLTFLSAMKLQIHDNDGCGSALFAGELAAEASVVF